MKFNELITLLEMPLRIDPIDVIDRDENQYFNKYNNYEKVGEFQVGKEMIGVYIHTSLSNSKIRVYSLVLNNTKIATYSGDAYKDGIITTMTSSFGKKYNLKGLMYYFYIYFLMNKYNFVLSDDSLTEKGFKFWYSNFDNFINQGFKISIAEYDYKNVKIVKQLNSKEEMNEYYGNMISKPLAGKYRYMLTK